MERICIHGQIMMGLVGMCIAVRMPGIVMSLGCSAIYWHSRYFRLFSIGIYRIYRVDLTGIAPGQHALWNTEGAAPDQHALWNAEGIRAAPDQAPLYSGSTLRQGPSAAQQPEDTTTRMSADRQPPREGRLISAIGTKRQTERHGCPDGGSKVIFHTHATFY